MCYRDFLNKLRITVIAPLESSMKEACQEFRKKKCGTAVASPSIGVDCHRKFAPLNASNLISFGWKRWKNASSGVVVIEGEKGGKKIFSKGRLKFIGCRLVFKCFLFLIFSDPTDFLKIYQNKVQKLLKTLTWPRAETFYSKSFYNQSTTLQQFFAIFSISHVICLHKLLFHSPSDVSFFLLNNCTAPTEAK